MLARRANMKSITRVVVYLSKENSCPQRARFQQSIVGHFCTGDEDSWMVNCALDQRLTQERGVDVGVAILLQSANQKVLHDKAVQDSEHLPQHWVPPGGHIEQDEQLLDTGLRELGEETGLWLEDREFSWRPLALWESVYPPMLSRGLPKRHHVVVYLLLLSRESHQQLQVRLKPNEAEVSAYAWLDEPVLASIAATQNEIGATSAMAGDLPPAVSITELQHGSAKTVAIPTTMFLSSAPLQGEDVERVSTGTKFALRLWLDTLAVQAE
uniref:nucleoside diphosphate-linked moiety X motif 17-like n=1 Tax=Podarcis muralis TaxID=64176 RepID=UPI00109F3443|nr:nucleoside diphosphate-linked moiety X motif 17-like [Podarcis muralis]